MQGNGKDGRLPRLAVLVYKAGMEQKHPRLAVLSDAHGNLEALNRVLEDLSGQKVDHIVCLGDAIGYGPEPDACARIFHDKNIPMVLGNHERALKSKRYLAWFNPTAQTTHKRTEKLLSDEMVAWLQARPVYFVEDGCRFVHGCPPKSVSHYLFELAEEAIDGLFDKFGEQFCFVGHTHELALVTKNGSMTYEEIKEGVIRLDPEARYIVNAGSVGQPRDGDSRAKYVILDRNAWTLEVRCVKYDIKKTADRIEELGFPKAYADRLW